MSFLKRLNVDAIKETLSDGVKAAQEGISSIDIGEIAKDAKDAAESGKDAIGKAIEDITRKKPDDAGKKEPSSRKLIELLWCMAYADEVITEAERGTLNELSSSIDEDYEVYRTEIENDFMSKLTKSSEEYGHAAAIKIEAKSIIESLELTSTESKLLCWNLLALAGSDELDENEIDLIRFIGEQLGLETSIVEELRNYSDAIIETSKARELLKQSARSYSEIEPLVNELEKREQALIEAAQSLITDR